MEKYTMRLRPYQVPYLEPLASFFDNLSIGWIIAQFLGVIPGFSTIQANYARCTAVSCSSISSDDQLLASVSYNNKFVYDNKI